MTDTERLDWLEASGLEMALEDRGCGDFSYYIGPAYKYTTLRELIDYLAGQENCVTEEVAP